MAWTEEQLLAMDARGSDILVSAAAGSGKTAVLVERIFKLVCEGADIERMLIVTFTNAVAAEMRERLAARFDAMADDPRMRAQAQACRRAHIQTLHSFCRDVCRAYFQAADVDPGFRIIDQQEAQLVAQRAVEDALMGEYEQVDDDLAALNALRGPDEIRDMVLALHTFLSSRADADEWLSAQTGDAMREKQRDIVRLAIKDRMKRVHAMLNGALRIAREDPDAGIYEQALERDIAAWPTGDDLVVLPVFEAARFAAAKGTPRGAANAPMCELIKLIRKRAKDITTAQGKLATLLMEGSEAERDYMVKALSALIRLEHAFEREYTRRKRERSALDFNDLEHCALRALSNEGVARSVRDMFDCVFVDEYQDISHIQESILDKVSAPRVRFMVGDVKQSIYRFRQADPSIFINKYDGFSASPGGDALRIDLNRNFRSRANVLNFVNGVFSRAMNRDEYEIDYDDAAALKPGLPVQPDDPAVEIHILGDEDCAADEFVDTDSDAEIEELSREESEAHVAAQIIKELLGTQMLDQKTGQLRSVQARDIVVLSRSVQSLAPKALEVLLGEGIPAYAESGGGYFDTYEVRQLLELMRVIDNRLRDYDLLGVLHSPMFGFTATDLGEIRAYTPTGSFSDALEAYVRSEEQPEQTEQPEAAQRKPERNPELFRRVRQFVGSLNEWQQDALAMTLSDLAWMLLDETGYYVYVGALPGGVERQANLRLLCSRAATYEDSQFGGLHGFLQYVEQLKRAGQDMTTAATLGEGDDVVRIMSVHKSKGLEFPIVIGLNLGASFNRSDSDDLVFNSYAGIGMYRMDERMSARHNTVARQSVLLRRENEQLAEELRVLYVLLTRARDRLILVGSDKKLWASSMMWHYGVPTPPGRMLDWIMPAAYAMMESGEANIRYYGHPARKQAHNRPDATLTDSLAELRATEVDAAIYNRLTWKYPHQAAVLAPLKLTASHLGREVEGPTVLPECRERPLFLSEQDMNALEKGVATHTVMQWLKLVPLRGLSGAELKAEVRSQLDALAARGTLTQAQRRGVREGMITRFFESEIGRRMLSSERVEREWPFNLRMSAGEVLSSSELGENSTGERMLVQGVIDCCFIDDGGWVLIDYKTDREDDMDLLRERYISQLNLYTRALDEVTHMPVRQKGLFLLRKGAFLDLTDAE